MSFFLFLSLKNGGGGKDGGKSRIPHVPVARVIVPYEAVAHKGWL